ncbi:MAG: 2-oxo acid dehydrogenase subunit E2 [Kiritimatiellae bacterium]|nr:2-oxo acid dehydrogenase subunit E2 [Kiritimatiellia bacterium]
MATTMKLPSLGENITGGDVVKVLVKPGDTIAKDQPVIEIETGKASMEVPAAFAGRVESVLAKTGETLKIGQPILTIAGAGDSTPPTATPAPAPAAAAPSKPAPAAAPAAAPKTSPRVAESKASGGGIMDLPLPPLGENIEGGDVVKVLVKPGDRVKKDQAVIEIETGKAAMEVPSPVEGEVVEVLAKKGVRAKIGETLLRLKTSGAAPAIPAPPAPKTAPASLPAASEPAAAARAPEPAIERIRPATGAERKRVPVAAAPSVRRLAREIGVDIEDVTPHGAQGRITIEDVKRHARQINTGRKVRTHCALESTPLPDFSPYGTVTREPMSRIRTATAEHLGRAWATIPHVTQHAKADITELEVLRKRFAPRTEAAGGKLTVTAILLKICAAALKVFPKFNASLDMAGREIVYKKFFNLGVAVDTERGLLVPVVRNVDQKNIVQIAVEMGEIAQRAREGRITPDDLAGGTFTVTNLGSIGGSFFTPIINAPEVAILGVSRAAMQPVVRPSGAIEPRLMMPLSLSYDHRLIDGADGARFLKWVVEAVEEPMLISLEG